MIYKVSYVVIGSQHPGAIINHIERPKVGDRLSLRAQPGKMHLFDADSGQVLQ